MYVKTIERVGYNRMIRYNAKIMSIVDIEGMKPKNVKEVLIIQVDDRNTDFWIPSQLTDYTRFVHVNSSINTKVKSIRAICGFLNYIKEQVILGYDECFYRLKTKGIHELKHIHLANYINYLTDKTTNIYETVKDKEAILIRFYDFLYLKGVTSGNDAKILHKVVQMGKKGTGKKSSNRGKVVLVSPFEGNSNYRVKYPPKSRKSKPVLKDMAQEVWEQMIEYAEKYYPQIAFGVALQCMGGLRIGEVVNLALDSVIGIREDNYLTADIKDRFDEFFGDRDISPLKSQLKSDSGREQPVFNFNGELFNLWEKHLKKDRKNQNSNALFIDEYGQAMSGDTYEETFKKMKKGFIEIVGQNSEILKKRLEFHSWGSHIGRHIFTNHLIKTGYLDMADGRVNATFLMVLRGDTNITTALGYIDTTAVVETVIDKIKLISKIAIRM